MNVVWLRWMPGMIDVDGMRFILEAETNRLNGALTMRDEKKFALGSCSKWGRT